MMTLSSVPKGISILSFDPHRTHDLSSLDRERLAAFAVAGSLLGWARECDVLSYAAYPPRYPPAVVWLCLIWLRIHLILDWPVRGPRMKRAPVCL